MAVVGSQIAIRDRDSSPCGSAVRIDETKTVKVLFERYAGLVDPFSFGRCRIAMARNSRERHQPLPVGDAQERVIDLGLVEAKQEIVAKPLDARYFKTHLSFAFYLCPFY